MAADGSIVIQVDLDTDNAEKEYSKLKTQIKRTTDEITDLQKKKSPLVEQAEQLRQKLKAAQAEADRFGEEWRQGVIGADRDQTAALNTVRDLEYQYEQVVKQIDKIDEKLLPNIQKVERMTNEAGELRKEISQTSKNADKAAKNTEKMGKAVQKASSHAQTFTQRMKRMLRQVIEFGIVFGAYGAFTNWIWSAVKANDEAVASIARFKAALLTTVQPILNVLIPAFTKLVEVATQVMMVFARLTAAIFGTTVEESADAAEGLWNEQNAIEGIGEAAKKATKQLASFDEINKLMGDTSNSASTPEVDIKDPIVPDFSGLKDIKLPEWLENIVTKIEATIADIRFELSDGFSLDDDTTLTTVLSTALGAFIGGTVTRSGGGLLLGAALGFLASLYLDKFKDAGTTSVEVGRDFLDNLLPGILTGLIGLTVGGIKGGIFSFGLGMSIDLLWGELVEATSYEWIGGTALIASLLTNGALSISKNTPTYNKGTLALTISLEFGILSAYIKDLAAGETSSLLAKGIYSLVAAHMVSSILSAFGVSPKLAWGSALVAIPLTFIFQVALEHAEEIIAVAEGVVNALEKMQNAVGIQTTSPRIEAFEDQEKKETAKTEYAQQAEDIRREQAEEALENFRIHDPQFSDNRLLGIENPEGFETKFPTRSGGSGGASGTLMQSTITSQMVTWIPKLATGAVIPPNREFLAVLGDQKSGTNIEAPLDTIVQAMQIALANGNGGSKNEAVLELDGEVLGRVMYKLYNRENSRIGVSLAGGMA